MLDDKISDETRELPEVQLHIVVYTHIDVDDRTEIREKATKVRYAIEAAIADEDNGLDEFVYPEVQIAWNETRVNGQLRHITASER